MTSPTLGALWTFAGYATALIVFWLDARSRRLATRGFGIVALAALCGGVLGAKLVQWLLPGAPVSWNMFLDPQSGGKTILGGLLGGWLVVGVTKRRLGLHRSTGDGFALAIPAGEAVGRVGCYFYGCCHGIVCEADLPWAVWQHAAWRHPAQLYTGASCALLFGLMLWLRPRLSREGELFRAFLLAYGALRFGLEFWREREIVVAGLSTAQLVCLALMLFGWRLLQRERIAVKAARLHEAGA